MIAAMNAFGGMSATDLLAMLGGKTAPTASSTSTGGAAASPIGSILSAALSDPAKAIQSILAQVAVAHASNAGATDAALATMGDTSVSATSVRESDASGSHALVSVALAAPGYAAASGTYDFSAGKAGSLVVATSDSEVEISNGTSAASGLNDYFDNYRRYLNAATREAAPKVYENIKDDVAQYAQKGAVAGAGNDDGKYLYVSIFTESGSSPDLAAQQVQQMVASFKNGALSSAQGFGYVGSEYSIAGFVGNKDAELGGFGAFLDETKYRDDPALAAALDADGKYFPVMEDLIKSADQGGIGTTNGGASRIGRLVIALS